MSHNFSTIQYVKLSNVLAKMRMKSQANKLALSYLWWVLEPLILVSLFYVLFSYVLNRSEDNFFTFMIIGKIVFLWFSKSVTTASNALLANKGILAQRAIPKWVFPLASVQEITYKSIIALVLMLIIAFLNGFYPSFAWMQILPIIIVSYLFIVGVSFVCSILVSIAQDFANLIGMGMLGLMFASGIFWDIASIQNESIRDLILIVNPLATMIYLWREIVMHNNMIDFSLLISPIIISSVLIIFSLSVFKKWNNQLTRFIFS